MSSNRSGRTGQFNIQNGIFQATDDTIKSAVDSYLKGNRQNLPPIGEWDTSRVTDMRSLFYNKPTFNEDISNWDVSNVVTFDNMFYCDKIDVNIAPNPPAFNQNINNWNVSRCRSFNRMFATAVNFNQPLNNWNVSNATSMHEMFLQARSFNQPLNDWDVSNVVDMGGMFNGARSFNQPLDNWNVSNVTDMSSMFAGTSFNQPLNNWNVSNVTSMKEMFRGSQFNQPLNKWNVSKVRNLHDMFYGARSFNQDLSNWNDKISPTVYNNNPFSNNPFYNATSMDKNFKFTPRGIENSYRDRIQQQRAIDSSIPLAYQKFPADNKLGLTPALAAHIFGFAGVPKIREYPLAAKGEEHYVETHDEKGNKILPPANDVSQGNPTGGKYKRKSRKNKSKRSKSRKSISRKSISRK
jgi:surface protein